MAYYMYTIFFYCQLASAVLCEVFEFSVISTSFSSLSVRARGLVTFATEGLKLTLKADICHFMYSLEQDLRPGYLIQKVTLNQHLGL